MAFGRLASLFVDIVVQTTKYQTQLNNMQNQTKQAANNMQASFMKIGLGAGGIFLIKKALTEVTSTVLSKSIDSGDVLKAFRVPE